MTPFTLRPHRLRSRKELTDFMEAGFLSGGTLDVAALVRYLSAFGPAGIALPARIMTDKGRSIGLRCRERNGVPGIQMMTGRSRFPFTPRWQDLSLPSDEALLEELIRIECVFCDGAVFMLDYPH